MTVERLLNSECKLDKDRCLAFLTDVFLKSCTRQDGRPLPSTPHANRNGALNTLLWPWGTVFLLNRNHKSIKQILKRKCNERNNENRMLPARRGPFQHSHSFSNMSLLDIKPIKEGSAQLSLSRLTWICWRFVWFLRMPPPPLKVIESWFIAASKAPDWTRHSFLPLYVQR